MPPELPTLKLLHLRDKTIPAGSSLFIRHSLPVNVLRATFSVATLSFERARIRASGFFRCSGGDRACLAIAADRGESDLSHDLVGIGRVPVPLEAILWDGGGF